MSSTTKTLLQLLEEEQARSDLLQTKITRLERELGEAKDFEDKFVVQTRQLSIKDAALLELQTAFDRASPHGNDAYVKKLQELLDVEVAEADQLRLMAIQRDSDLQDSREKLLKAEVELSESSRKYEEELRLQRRDIEELLAVCRNSSMSAFNQVESAVALIQRSLKSSTGDDRNTETVQSLKPSSIPGDTLRVHPSTRSIQFGKPSTLPHQRETLFRPATKGDYLEATKTPARNQPVLDDGFTAAWKGRTAFASKGPSQGSLEIAAASINPCTSVASSEKRAFKTATEGVPLSPGSLQAVDQDVRKQDHAPSSRYPALIQASPPAPAPAPAPTPTPAPKHQPRMQEKGSEVKPRLPTNMEAPTQSTTPLNPGAIAFTSAPTKSMAQVAAAPRPPKQSTRDFWLETFGKPSEAAPVIKSKMPDKQKMKDATAGKVVESGQPKREPEPEPEQTIKDSRLAETSRKRAAEEDQTSSESNKRYCLW